MKNIILIPTLIMSMLTLQGCLVTAVGAGVGAIMYGSAKKTDADNKCKDSYNQYTAVMLKNKQTPMTVEQYCKK